MSIRRTQLPFEGHFTQIPNAWLRDQRLSRRARGLLAEIMSHQHGWVISVHSLWKTGTEGREAIRKTIVELAEFGYLERDQEHGEHGRFGEMNYRLSSPEAFTVPQKLGDGTETGARSTVAQESAPKNTIQEEDHLKGGAPAPDGVDNSSLVPYCKRHAAAEGSDKPCAACKRARLAWEQSIATVGTDTPLPAQAPRYDPEKYCAHLQLRTEYCDACAQEARKALELQFGSAA